MSRSGPRLKNDPQRRLENIITLSDVTRIEDFALLDAVTLHPEMVDQLRSAEAATRRLRRAIEARLANDERVCPCGAVVTGRADRRYCSDRCRLRAHRIRHKLKVRTAALPPSDAEVGNG